MGLVRVMLISLLLALVSDRSLMSQEPRAELSTIPVCRLFEDLRSYSGRMVQVRGRLITSRRGWALGEDNCPHAFETYGLKWGTAVELQRAGSGLVKPPVGFSPDIAALDRMEKLLCFLNETTAEELGVQIVGTFVGELRTRDKYGPPVTPSGRSAGTGFGDLGALPAQLVLRTVKDLVIRQIGTPGLGTHAGALDNCCGDTNPLTQTR